MKRSAWKTSAPILRQRPADFLIREGGGGGGRMETCYQNCTWDPKTPTQPRSFEGSRAGIILLPVPLRLAPYPRPSPPPPFLPPPCPPLSITFHWLRTLQSHTGTQSRTRSRTFVWKEPWLGFYYYLLVISPLRGKLKERYPDAYRHPRTRTALPLGSQSCVGCMVRRRGRSSLRRNSGCWFLPLLWGQGMTLVRLTGGA